jgi:hypothetical protein
VERLETAFGLAFCRDLPSSHRRSKALKGLRIKFGQLKQAANQPAGRLTDDDATGRGECLEPSGQIGRLPDHSLFLGGALPNQVANHD